MNRPCFALGIASLVCATLATDVIAQGTYRNQRLFVVPRGGTVVIDGELDDWDLSGEILTFVSEASAEFQSARTAAMYDSESLYLSSRIADPTPLKNRHDPAVNPDFGWDADAFQFRICLDPKLGYPIKLQNANWGAAGDPNEGIVHMTLWHYSDKQLPVLHAKFGMNFHDADGYHKGIVPAEKFQAAYKQWANGKGYTLEYRIPWSTLKATQPPKAGDLTGAALQIQWSDPVGEHSVGSGWAVDLLRHAGFSYQSVEPWGKVIFAEKGNLPKELTQEGLPPVRTLPLKLDAELPKESVVSAVLVDDKGDRLRHVLAAQTRPGGKFTELWDGLDDAGKVIPPGRYRWLGAYHEPFSTKYMLSVANSGRPGYPTPDGRGAWGGDWAPPVDVCLVSRPNAAPQETRVFVAWAGCEAGPGIVAFDIEGNKLFGLRYAATYLATDGEWVFAYLPHEKQIRAYAAADGRQTNFLRGEMWAEHNSTRDESKDGQKKQLQETTCTGLTCADGKLYVANSRVNEIAEYDARQGKLLRRLTAAKPTWVCARTPAQAGGPALLIVSDGKVNSLSLADGKVTPFATEQLNDPQGIAIGPGGQVFVSNQGKRQDVAVFDAAGKYVRSIGRAGGRPTRGTWAADGMFKPRGLAVAPYVPPKDTTNGIWQSSVATPAKAAAPVNALWVCEDDFQPKRISFWDVADGKVLDEKFGPCYVSTPACMDPADPTRVYSQNVEWEVDLEQGTWRPLAVMFDERRDTPHYNPHMINNIVFTAKNGRQYMHAAAIYAAQRRITGHFLWIRRGDHFEAVAGVISPTSELTWRDNSKNVSAVPLFWEDRNGDGVIQQDETRPSKLLTRGMHSLVDADLNFYASGMYNQLYWQRVAPKQILDSGVPLYDDATLKQVDYATDPNDYTHDLAVNPRDGSVLMNAGTDIKHLSRTETWPLNSWSRDGKLQWRYRQGCRWYDAYEFPIPKPGQLWGSTRSVGVVNTEHADITGFSSYHGLVHLLTTEGVVLGTIMKDGRGGETGHDLINCEWFTGQLVRVPAASFKKPANSAPDAQPRDRFFMLGGDQDGRVLEVFGLDTVRPLAGEVVITDADAAAANTALAEWNALQAKGQALVLARATISAGQSARPEPAEVTKQLPTIDWVNIRGATVNVDDKRNFAVKLAYDPQYLYVRFDVTTPFELTNSMQETQQTFKGGNCIDVQLAGDSQADASRKTPALGDVRVLLTRRAGTPIAVVYRPKAAAKAAQPFVFRSPTGEEAFEAIETIDNLPLHYEKTPTGFMAIAALPLDRLNFHPKPGTTARLDLGYLFGNETGNLVSVRKYWNNHSFTSGVTNDVPHESRLEPAEWGTVAVE